MKCPQSARERLNGFKNDLWSLQVLGTNVWNLRNGSKIKHCSQHSEQPRCRQIDLDFGSEKSLHSPNPPKSLGNGDNNNNWSAFSIDDTFHVSCQRIEHQRGRFEADRSWPIQEESAMALFGRLREGGLKKWRLMRYCIQRLIDGVPR